MSKTISINWGVFDIFANLSLDMEPGFFLQRNFFFGKFVGDYIYI